MARQDPFYIIRGEVTDSLNDVQQKMSRFHGLISTNPERKEIAKQVETECNLIMWQLNELNSAVDVAAENPARFNLTSEELNSRRKWIDNTRRQVNGIKETLKTATAAPQLPPQDNKFQQANDKFLGGEFDKQQLIIKKQDQALDEIEQHVNRIGRMGRAIGEELEQHERLINELDSDVDTTHSRLKATAKKMQEIIRKSGSNTQLGIIVFLIVVLLVLAIFAFN
uniref:t-SNARE coiled-coil homology domain-containing protein n=1 Tax=Chlamydomonas leiostraca TaxID=1034604 RepID=A0A7S0WJC1_9CHLO|mmetsp:Transcript_15222/g.37937  ORF Transcript_15222/g.37937 Transcript_15222/m.37937 type:complete len:225 (+) Transcript_15222:187-861(+)|eukprot:CAMPEP_0202866378 /NCGR_PEP_ID=MMETSP1391-20130828/7407_1 /ASSEMBLY_ACC=CAM_ASM_000867 /TAXON_ID=1034604 /ORGANISM="Chlamydomonas leiostraca, Strain SAG 11-49" /LENGTH=224 /DNA_ID=CAMNT_0049546317 /DNA_START=187 /DNA_END=861 /DNA_ORIENTATION=+